MMMSPSNGVGAFRFFFLSLFSSHFLHFSKSCLPRPPPGPQAFLLLALPLHLKKKTKIIFQFFFFFGLKGFQSPVSWVHDSRASPNNELGTFWFQLSINATLRRLVIEAKLELDRTGSVTLFLVRAGKRIAKLPLIIYDSLANKRGEVRSEWNHASSNLLQASLADDVLGSATWSAPTGS